MSTALPDQVAEPRPKPARDEQAAAIAAAIEQLEFNGGIFASLADRYAAEDARGGLTLRAAAVRLGFTSSRSACHAMTAAAPASRMACTTWAAAVMTRTRRPRPMARRRIDAAALEAARLEGLAAYEAGDSVLTCPHQVKPRSALRLRQAWCTGWFDAAEAKARRVSKAAVNAAADRSDW